MSYNAQLYREQPVQFDVVGIEDGQHFFPRAKEKKLHPCRRYAWPSGIVEGFHLVEMEWRAGGSDTSNYRVRSHRHLPSTVGHVRRANAELYELMLQRANLKLSIESDPLFLDLQRWCRGQEPLLTVPPHFTDAHEELLREYADTGVMPTAIDFISSRTSTLLSDLLIYNLEHV